MTTFAQHFIRSNSGGMKRLQRFRWTIILLITVVLTALSGWQYQGDRPLGAWQSQRIQEPVPSMMQATLMTPQDTRHHEATLTDATSLYRVCSSRPQRLLPTQGSKTERTNNPCDFVRKHIVKPLHSLHDSRFAF